MAIDTLTAFDGLVVPTRADPANFPARGDDMMSRFPTFQTQINTISGQINLTAIAAAAAQVAAEAARDSALTSAAQAAASALAAAASSNAAKWVTGQNITAGDNRWSPADPQKGTYKALNNLTPSTVDPYNDPTNWTPAVPSPFSQVEVLSIAANTSLSAASKNVVRVAATVRGASLLLPDGTTLSGRNGIYSGKNVGALALPLRDQSGALLAVVPAGASFIATLEDGSTSAGVWGVICPETKPAFATGAAQVVASVVTWVGISAIPGVANKAVLAYVSGSQMTVRIATLNSDGTVSLGTALNLTGAANGGAGEMICCCDSTKAIASCGSNAANGLMWSLTLDTGANTITSSASASLANGVNTYVESSPFALDTTRVAWQAHNTTFGTAYIVVATHGGAGAPTATMRDVSSEVGADRANAICGIGGGSILATGNAVAATIYTSSGNTLTVASTIAGTNLYQEGTSSGASITSWVRLFNPSSGKGVVAFGSGTDASGGTHPIARDNQRGLSWSGTTLGSDYSAYDTFKQQVYANGIQNGYVGAWSAGNSHCVFGGATSQHSPGLRVMRQSGDTFSEVCFGAPDGMPPFAITSANKVSMRAAAVSGTKCLAVVANRSSFPVIMGMEVMKA